ncbi:hypothetical protein M9H77_14130 [Catharanthus roseus]|uniref:Uncharacterized protein n=1 Tax=Catharanthus roseus TaxID=4058 RepID=A0ACC0BMF3_CATRO|nr:hypothetical protein M9H77_14130 [Catharanthus roseus]
MEKDGNFRCVDCGLPIKKLYIQYSPGNIRLMKCENCKAVADEYIECEIMIIVIDLILHKPRAYRHTFYNMLSRDTRYSEGLLWKLSLGFLILDAYIMWVLSVTKEEGTLAPSFVSLLQCFGKILVGVVVGNFFFTSLLLFGSAKFLNASSKGLRCKDTLLAILISSYFKIFLVAMMVWEFPASVIFLVDIFVLSSNTVALKVITDSATIRCLGVCFAAFSLKCLASHLLRTLH